MTPPPATPSMPSAPQLGSALLAAASLLLTACDDLLPGQRQPPVVVAADSAPPAPKRSSPAREASPVAEGAEAAAAFRQMSQTLRRLVAAEQGFYAENGTYSGDLQRVGFRPLGETEVHFLWVARDGWGARVIHPALPGRDCIVYTGVANPPPTTRRHGRSGREGMIVCDDERTRAPASSPVPAAAAEPPPAPPDTTNALDAVNPSVQMRVDLRKLGEAQAAYFGTQGVYSRRLERLPLQFGWQRGVTVTPLHADQRSWTARATHEARPGRSCVIFFGSPPARPATQAQRRVPERSGVPVCDD